MSAEIDRSPLNKLSRLAYEDLLRLPDPLAEDGKTAAFDPAELVNQAYLDLAEKTAHRTELFEAWLGTRE